MKQLCVGVAKACVTPPLGTILYGYPRKRLATAVGDDLEVIAAALTYGDTKALLLSADICSCSKEMVDRIAAAVEEQTGFPKECMIYNTTHTHSGPTTRLSKSGWGEPDYHFLENILYPQSIKVAVEAVHNLQPAVFGVATTECEVGINRRNITADGKVNLGQNPWGVMDKEMTVMSFKSPDMKNNLLNIVHYGCHGTASGSNFEITRDWPGTMKDVMDRETGTTTMFIQGPIGECGPRCPNGKTAQSYEVARELGYRAGHDALRAWNSIKEWRNVPVTTVCGEVRVPYDALPAKETVLERLASIGTEEELLALREAGDEGAPKKLTEYYHLKGILDEYEEGVKSHYVIPQCILSIGSVAIVPFPFEMFFYTPLQLRRYSKFQHTLSLSNTNDTRAYLPSQDQLCRGGYEVWQFGNFNTYKMVDDADTYLVVENLKLLNENFEKSQQE